MRACVRAIKHGAATLSREHLERTALSISQCEKILAESREGETRLNDQEDARMRFRTLLGIGSQSLGGGAPDGVVPRHKRKRGRPGQRAPQRDPISQEAVGVCMMPRLTTAGNRRVPTSPLEVTCIVSRRSELAQRRLRALPGIFHGWRQLTLSNPVSLLIRSCDGGFPAPRASGQDEFARSLPSYSFYVTAHTLNGVGISRTALGFSPPAIDLRRATRPFDGIAMGRSDFLCSPPSAPAGRGVLSVMETIAPHPSLRTNACCGHSKRLPSAHVHRLPLESICPFCGRRQYVLACRSRPGYCSQCDRWLGRTCGATCGRF